MPSVQNSVSSDSILSSKVDHNENLEDFKGKARCLSAKVGRRRKRGSGQRKQPQQNNETKNKKFITSCPHTTLDFYAKGMCKNCYHARGREKPANKCPHIDRANYAHGICKNCYLSAYHRERRAQKKASLMEKLLSNSRKSKSILRGKRSSNIDRIEIQVGTPSKLAEQIPSKDLI